MMSSMNSIQHETDLLPTTQAWDVDETPKRQCGPANLSSRLTYRVFLCFGTILFDHWLSLSPTLNPLEVPMASHHSSESDRKDAFAHQDSPKIPIYNEVEAASSEDLSLGAILRGTAAKPMTTFEKKAALINAELDKFGLGKYQICIWFLCGFGYFLDLAWSQGVGLVSTAIYQEMNVKDGDTGTIFACANAGLAIGALGFGLAVDIIGRKWAFNLTCLITSVFGILLVSSWLRPSRMNLR
jgi:Sugar (and other) transporter